MTPSEVIVRAQALFEVPPVKFQSHRACDDDSVEARACAAWALRELGLSPKEVAGALGYYDHQRPAALIRRVETTPRLLARARKLLQETPVQ